MEPMSVYYVHAWPLPNTPTFETKSPLKISPRHRVDAELFYLSRIARESYLSDAARNAAHPRWVELCERESRSKRYLLVMRTLRFGSHPYLVQCTVLPTSIQVRRPRTTS